MPDLAEGLDVNGDVLITSAPKLAVVTSGPTSDVLSSIRQDIVSGTENP